jgi:2,4-dienoyl-CoA reductase-like NADH-dependent reductase (Old Yellow Enzyme family)
MLKDYEALFEPCEIGRIFTSNRLASQPMEANDATATGGMSELTRRRYLKLAEGCWGLTFMEAVSITEKSLAHKNGLVLNRTNLDGFKKLVESFKQINPQGLLLIQLTHSGIKSGAFSQVKSVMPSHQEGVEYLSGREIEEIQNTFVECALLAEEAGLDGIDFKLCHGYLGTEMIRPANTRTDRWGGEFENRTRLFVDAVREIKSRLQSRHFLLGSKISMFEGIPGGCGTCSPDETVEDLVEMKRLVALMDTLGMDYVNVSAGLPGSTTAIAIPTKETRLFYLDHFRYAKEVKTLRTRLKVIGSAYSILNKQAPSMARDNIVKGYVDFAGFGRQSWADPLFPVKLKQGDKIQYCTSCMGCGSLVDNQHTAGCIVYNDYYRKLNKELNQ